MVIVGNTLVPGIAAEALEPQPVVATAVVAWVVPAPVEVQVLVLVAGRIPQASPEVELAVEQAHRALAQSKLELHKLPAWMPQQSHSSAVDPIGQQLP